MTRHLQTRDLSRRTFMASAATTALIAAAASPAMASEMASSSRSSIRGLGSETATDWVRTLYSVVMAEGLTPPAAARFYYYTSLTMYETAVPDMGSNRSLAGKLKGLGHVPGNGGVDGQVAISVAVAAVSLGLLPTASEASVNAIRAHADAVIAERSSVIDQRLLRRSTRQGERAAEHLLQWMSEDGYAEALALPYTPPVGPGLWRSTPPNFGTAIEPYWATVRPAALKSADEVVPIPPVEFSTEVGSAFYEEAMVTYRQSFENTEEQIAIARFWTDNPRLSGLPAGHWFLLFAQLADEDLDLALDETLEAMVLLGAALHDAFLSCWTWKYVYNLIRPVTYVRDHIDPNWNTLVNTPQFPEYTSGHSVGSGAADHVLTALFGSFPFVDRTGEARGLGARSFTSFTHAAEEAAGSRLYGGIHYPMGITNGVIQGREVGRKVERRLGKRVGRPGSHSKGSR